MTRKIPLSGKHGQGRFALVDDADFAWLSLHRWHCAARPCKTRPDAAYAARGISREGKGSLLLMHREILGASVNIEVDHKDGNGLNNTRRNLRLATRSENARNQRKQADRLGKKTLSVYKGVFYSLRPGRRKRWYALVVCDYKTHHCGMFYSEIEAAEAYDNTAGKLHGEFAQLNFPGD